VESDEGQKVFEGFQMKILITILLILSVASVAMAQKIKVASDPNADLTRYRTYGWAKGMVSPNPIIHQIIVEAVDRAMTSKGLTKVETDPDIKVVVWAVTDSNMHISYPSWYPGMNSIATGVAVGAQQWPVTEGTLVIDITDAVTKNSVWRGTATHTLSSGPSGSAAKDAKSVEKPIRKAVEKMFKKYPALVGANP
jgi:hypothetical protein